jgi:short-subunit dehydrogenase
VRIVIVGATSVIAQHCARLWACEPVDLVLVGRDAARTETVAADLRVRSPSSRVSVATADFTDPQAVARIVEEVGATPIDVALIAHGSLPDQAACQGDLALAREAMDVNGLSPVLFAEAFAGRMERGSIVLVGSVAGDRGRKSNYVYGAAKGLVTRYAQGLQHRFADSDVHVMLVKPGPTQTPMTAHLRARGAKLASPEEVAQRIVRGVQARKRVVYAPAKWAVIMMVIRHLPHFIFRRMDI